MGSWTEIWKWISKKVFRNASKDSTYTLYIKDQTFKELPANMFDEAKIQYAEITNSPNLVKVSPYAFSSSSKNLISLTIKGAKLNQSPRDLFDAFSLLPGVHTFTVENTSLSVVPDNAFRNLNGLPKTINNNIRVDLGYNKITEIGSYAFGFNIIKDIQLRGNPIQKVKSYAFAKTQNENPKSSIFGMFIQLFSTSPNFTPKSFVADSLLGAKMPVRLEVSGPRLNSLPQIPFALFLIENSKNSLTYLQSTNQLECGCNMIWLHLEKERFQKQIRGPKAGEYPRTGQLICKDGRDFFDFTLKDFAHCTGQQFVSSQQIYASTVNSTILSSL